MNKIRIVFAGLGGFGKRWLNRVLLNDTDVEFVGVVTRSEEKHSYIMETMGVAADHIYDNLEDALDAEHPDLFFNVTPVFCHLEYCEEALKRGIPVFTEKPIANNLEEANILLQLANEKQVPVYIGENYRFSMIIEKAKEIIDTNKIGQIFILIFIVIIIPKSFIYEWNIPYLWMCVFIILMCFAI